MKVSLLAALTADGRISRELEDLATDWTSYEDKVRFTRLSKKARVIVVGARTYATFDRPMADRRIIVYTNHPENVTLERAEATTESPQDLIKRLTAEGEQELIICGGTSIYDMFMQAGVVDDVYLTIEPQFFGEGVTLFTKELSTTLELVACERPNEGTIFLHYRVNDVRLPVKILELCDMGYQRVLAPQKGYRNTSYPVALPRGQFANIILYKNEEGMLQRIKRANYVSDFLATKEFPTRRTLSKIINLKSSTKQRYAAVYSYLPGRTIPWEAYTKTHIKLLGQTLGEMHHTLREVKVEHSVADEYTAINRRMERYFNNPTVVDAMQRKLGLTLPGTIFQKNKRLLHLCQTLPAQQTLHMDFVRSNILFRADAKQVKFPKELADPHPHPRITTEPIRTLINDRSEPQLALTGILDFEKTAFGHPAFDVARTLAFLLVDCKHKPEPKIRKYFLESGYAKRSKMPLPNAKLLEALVDLFLLHDFYKFLRHNPYEFLAQNEHFVRTRELLVKRGLIR